MSFRGLREQYTDRVQFLVIYIREAHPIDGWHFDTNKVQIHDPKTIDERRSVAGQCETAMEYGIPTLVDEMNDAVMTAYGAWPERLYLVGRDGRIAYAGGPGPFEFRPDELKDAIDRELDA